MAGCSSPEDFHNSIQNAAELYVDAGRLEEMRRQLFTQEISVQAVERMTLEGGLRVAVQRNELFLVYQPQVDLITGEITGCEALFRWRHPEHGLLPPAKFATGCREQWPHPPNW